MNLTNLIILALALFLASCGGKETELSLDEKKIALEDMRSEITRLEIEICEADPSFCEQDPVAITTTDARVGSFEPYVRISGVVTSKQNIVVSAETGGTVQRINVTEGQRVGAGSLIASLDASIVQNSIYELESALDLATTVYEKRASLWEKNIGSEIDYLNAKNQKENLEKKLGTTQAQLNQSRITSPISGTVDEIFVNQGEMAGPGMRVARIVNLSQVRVEADASESYVGKFTRGEKVDVYFPSLNKEVKGKVSAIGQVIDPQNRTFKVEVSLTNSDGLLKPNLLAEIRVKEDNLDNMVIVPTKLIQQDKEGDFLYISKDGVAHKIIIKTGQSFDGETVILSGLEGEEILIDAGFRSVYQGVPVNIQ